jgi:hypothetical protein
VLVDLLLVQCGIRVCIGRESQEVLGFHRDAVHYSSHPMLSLQRLPDQLSMVVCVRPLCGGHRPSGRVAVHATGVERHSYEEYSTWSVFLFLLLCFLWRKFQSAIQYLYLKSRRICYADMT